ncbi:MAG: DNA repair protein RecN [Sedimentibacter sp.]|uniref:DNA repair protein RecN n=1 Tax=Sedimentibacter sp. TaxID=1960295 RepID=UPI00298291A4|nr:DNA repair protein RecN [Sedimentibacter sp.]MDW5300317.1 DNA repair protein RecN [Sedimentibacter sp.]
MLISLNISNFAVFENESINFENGFNVFTGETGSGKSILIEALSLILGGRASKDLIRKGSKSALVEAIFDISSNNCLCDFLASENIDIDNEDFLIISREILENGKSINKINRKTVPLGVLKDIGNYLIDIYGQFGHESLFKKENHIILLDSLIQKELSPLFEEYNKLFLEYNKKCDDIDTIKSKLINKDLKIEQLKFEIDEIEEAQLKEHEEDELLKEIKKLSNIQEIKNSVFEAIKIMNNNSGLNNVYSILNKIKSYDDVIASYLLKTEILLEELQFFVHDLRDYSEKLDIDENKMNFIENRMSLISRLKRKYGYSIEKINEYKNLSEKELKVLKEAESNLSILMIEKNELYRRLKEYAEIISKKRKNAADFLEKQILKELYDLNMKNIMFKVNIERKSNFSFDGIDQIEFMISTNIGSDLNSVQKVVSGGEASRIMLAFKKISSDIDSSQTMIFDEIDSGISGKTAQMSGIKMNYISTRHQVICITHSPQIASISKNHFLIEKKVVDNNTYSTVRRLHDEDRINEIARLLSGMKITEKSISNAKELIEFSSNI